MNYRDECDECALPSSFKAFRNTRPETKKTKH
jgi:hypothetical protein